VGFRPFIYNLALSLGIKGSVTNTTEGVVIKIEDLSASKLKDFCDSILDKKPPASVIENIKTSISDSPAQYTDFSIEKSKVTGNKFQLVSPDLATCNKCFHDITNEKDTRRYHYPFTNCTNCGPRFTIIKGMPYDRPRTTMDGFKMCPECSKEYNDPEDRRFHAQPNACIKCGPRLILADSKGKAVGDKEPLESASRLLKEGKLIGIKSLGGFQIACDASSDKVVGMLRTRKRRPSKPFAVMVPSLKWTGRYYHLNSTEMDSLRSPKAPIVLLKKKSSYPLSSVVSPGNKYEGIMLPYTPIHHILFEYIDSPLVMTSGNISEEPIASENEEAVRRLDDICDYYLLHDRDIYSRYDDSVIRIFRGSEMVLRRARGYAPYPIKLDIDIGNSSILAAGAHEKNTFTILTRNYGITSQHIGDLDTAQSVEFFRSSLKNYKKIFGIDGFDFISHDMHPDYRSTSIARSLSDDDPYSVQHHEAHIASAIAENNIKTDAIGFSWDGTGYGKDGKIWGSEVFSVDKDLNFKRIGHLTEKVLPGGDATIARPYRMAAVYLSCLSGNINNKEELSEYLSRHMEYKEMKKQEADILISQISSGFNSPFTTSMGRFFDAVSSILGLVHVITHEGEAAIALEMSVDDKYIESLETGDLKAIDESSRYDIKLVPDKHGHIIDDIHIFRQILKDKASGTHKGFISFKFHNTLAQIVLDMSLLYRNNTGSDTVILSGGVFQNIYLLNLCYTLLGNNGFDIYTNLKVPVNDGGISLGQAYMTAIKKLKIKRSN